MTWGNTLTAPPAEPPTKPSVRVSPPVFDGVSAYARAAIEAETRAVAEATEGTRNDTLNRAAFALGQLVVGGELDQTIVVRALRDAARHCGLGEHETEATITSGLTSGAKEPRRAPEPTAPMSPQVDEASTSEPAAEPDWNARYAAQAATVEAEQTAHREGKTELPKPDPFGTPLGVSELFVKLPPIPWLCEGLEFCPGAPALWAGFGFSAKSIIIQSLGLSVAAGAAAFGLFPVRSGRFLHFDFEQGRYLTSLRNQRQRTKNTYSTLNVACFDSNGDSQGGRVSVDFHPYWWSGSCLPCLPRHSSLSPQGLWAESSVSASPGRLSRKAL